jgi:hypothetical protein
VRLFVPLTRQEAQALINLARVERRRPQDQAAVMLAEALAPLGEGDDEVDEAGPRTGCSRTTRLTATLPGDKPDDPPRRSRASAPFPRRIEGAEDRVRSNSGAGE